MKQFRYEFASLPQFLSALIAFVFNTGIPYLAGDQIAWPMVLLVTASVYLSAGVRYRSGD